MGEGIDVGFIEKLIERIFLDMRDAPSYQVSSMGVGTAVITNPRLMATMSVLMVRNDCMRQQDSLEGEVSFFVHRYTSYAPGQPNDDVSIVGGVTVNLRAGARYFTLTFTPEEKNGVVQYVHTFGRLLVTTLVITKNDLLEETQAALHRRLSEHIASYAAYILRGMKINQTPKKQ